VPHPTRTARRPEGQTPGRGAGGGSGRLRGARL
jgi:hypothetical protein